MIARTARKTPTGHRPAIWGTITISMSTHPSLVVVALPRLGGLGHFPCPGAVLFRRSDAHGFLGPCLCRYVIAVLFGLLFDIFCRNWALGQGSLQEFGRLLARML